MTLAGNVETPGDTSTNSNLKKKFGSLVPRLKNVATLVKNL